MLQPLSLGGTIGICAPAGPVKREKLEAAIIKLDARGFRVKASEHIFDKHGFLSAPDDVRSAELQAMFADPGIDAVVSARGGVGSSRLLSRLNLEQLSCSGKPFLGFSDLTAVQWALWAKHQSVTFSGPLAVEFDGSLSAATERMAFDILADTPCDNWLDYFPEAQIDILRGGASQIIAPMLPGNLTMIASLIGTPYMPDLRGAILVIEDIAEPPYRVDRLLFHLRNAGHLQNLAALIVGDFGWEEDDDESRGRLRDSVLDATARTAYPILLGFPYGHGSERLTLPVGSPMQLGLKPGAMTLSYAISPFAPSA
ncbi:MAG: LD-carboxypeptidase [bacterium]|nr:LD-carboxypeptidase [bacterium]